MKERKTREKVIDTVKEGKLVKDVTEEGSEDRARWKRVARYRDI